jgi:aspartate ammonia-lyase
MSDETRAGLAGAALFRHLSADEITRLAELAKVRVHELGTVFFREGDDRDHLRVILDGLVEMTREVIPGTSTHLITYGAGDVIGEGILVGGVKHGTTATAQTAVRVLTIERDELEGLLREDHELRADMLVGVLEQVAARLDHVSPHAIPLHVKLSSGRTRREHDLIGDRDVPDDAYYGVQTLRAIENFHITGVPLSNYPDLVNALATVKLAAARANVALGQIPADVGAAIEAACHEIVGGKLHNQFVLDVIQGGAGTSTNMNANEVIANRALELMGRTKGEYDVVHPNNHVNCSQSTNDSYPTSLKLAMAIANRRLVSEVRLLVASFREKAEEFDTILKMGRTQLQDAVPMTLGQEFASFATSIEDEILPLRRVSESFLTVINMGGTAIGTGLNAPEGLAERIAKELADLTGLRVRPAADLVEATQDTRSFVLFSSTLKSLAVKLSKISNDLRLLSSGPRCGFGDIHLPAVQPGSTIMPGKVNPVIPEVVNQVAFRVIGNDLTVTMASEAGQLQLNAFEPVVVYAVLESIEVLHNAAHTLRVNCVDGIEANEEQLRRHVEQSIGIVTALVPVLGYGPSTELAAEALSTGRGVVELVREKGLLDEARIEELLSPAHMANSRRRD